MFGYPMETREQGGEGALRGKNRKIFRERSAKDESDSLARELFPERGFATSSGQSRAYGIGLVNFRF